MLQAQEGEDKPSFVLHINMLKYSKEVNNMKTSIKCEACGANLEIDSEKHLKFCPYCGAAVQIPKTAFEHEKEMAEFNEKVRQNQVQEKIKQEKKFKPDAFRICNRLGNPSDCYDQIPVKRS